MRWGVTEEFTKRYGDSIANMASLTKNINAHCIHISKCSYQKDLANVIEVSDSNTRVLQMIAVWELDSVSGYGHDHGYYYDPKSGYYYSDAIGNWVTQEEAFVVGSSTQPEPKGSLSKKPLSAASAAGSKGNGGPAPGLVIQGFSLNPSRSIKRQEEKKPKVVSKEEAVTLKARVNVYFIK
ncbi:hypothetical protein MKX01_032741 [Papaver californicum]|nr:hypothetical protein MKX01_032741 [Papaver californicum]